MGSLLIAQFGIVWAFRLFGMAAIVLAVLYFPLQKRYFDPVFKEGYT